MKHLIFSLMAMVFVLGCSNEDNTVQNVEFTTIAKGMESDFFESNSNSMNLVFTNSEAWSQFVESAGSEYFSEINIDFSQYEVVAIVDQIRPTATNLNILKIEEHDAHLLVVSDIKIGDATVVSRPYHVVKFFKKNKNVLFN